MPEDIAFRKVLNERYLEPFLTAQGQYKSHLESLAHGVSARPIKGVPIVLFAGEFPKEEDNTFIRWVYRTRHLSSVPSLKASVSVADVRLERKLRYEYVKLKARGQLRTRTRYASATPVATGSDPKVRSNPLLPTTFGGKHSRSMEDPCHDVRKHPRRMGNPAEGLSHTPTSIPTPGTLATSPDNCIGHDDDVASGSFPHGTGGSLAHQAASVVVGGGRCTKIGA